MAVSDPKPMQVDSTHLTLSNTLYQSWLNLDLCFPFIVDIDASGSGEAAVLFQRKNDN